MNWAKRIFLFLAVNFLVVLTISFLLKVFHINSYLSANGIDYSSLMNFCLLWGFGGALISLALSRKMAKWMLGVQIVEPTNQTYSNLIKLVVRLSKDAGLPSVPEIGIFHSPALNAFATGPTKRRSLVAVSTSLLNRMNEGELEAVLGHEIAHIANGDMVTMTLLQGVINAFVLFLARALAFALSSVGKGENKGRSLGSYYVLSFVFEIVFMILGSIVIALFSRFREYRADRGGAMLSSKQKMIAALEVLGTAQETPTLNKQSTLNALMISKPGSSGLMRLFSTHPPIEDRIRRLQEAD